jgi:hypothetical protein
VLESNHQVELGVGLQRGVSRGMTRSGE